MAPILSLVVAFSVAILLSVLKTEEITPRAEIYINWFRFDDIDSVRFDHFARHFDEFWYPAADDVDIFDSDLKWIVTIDHEGTVWIAKSQR